MTDYNRIIIYSIIIILTLLSSVIVIHEALRPTSFHVNYQSYHQGLNSFATEFVGKQFNKQGQLQQMLIAPNIYGYTDKNILLINKPYIKVIEATKPPWIITAEHGKVPAKRNVIYLWGDVKISQTDIDKTAHQDNSTTLLTRSLSYYPDKKFADGYAPIQVIQPEVTLQSIGGSIDLKTGIVKLFQQVKAQYINKGRHKILF